jgi:hypothetical protein
MSIIKLLFLLALVGFGYQYWTKHHQGLPWNTAAAVSDSQNGFVSLPPVTGASARDVLVIAAENCPHEAAQRADELARQLSRAGIPVTRLHQANFSIENNDSSVMDKVLSVMNGPLPIVFVAGKAKSDPSIEEVIAEYQAASR